MPGRGRRSFLRGGPRPTGADAVATARRRTDLGSFWRARSTSAVHVEDPADRFLHRYLAAIVVAALLRSTVTANQVTVARVFIGWTGAAALFWGFFIGSTGPGAAWLLAAALLFVAMILDCADGHLARLRREESRLGRILDGAADVVVVLPVYIILALGTLQIYGVLWFVVAAVAGLSMWTHSIVHDKVKRLYTSAVAPLDGGDAGAESASVHAERIEARRGGSWFARALLGVYVGYLRVQEGIVPPRKTRAPADGKGPRYGYHVTMRLNGLMGLGTHMLVLYVGLAFMALGVLSLLVIHLLFATGFNVVMVVVLWLARGLGDARAPTGA